MSTIVMTDEDRMEHAKRALSVFKTMISTVYAPLLRAVTGNSKLKVEPTANLSATDGQTVFLMVPWVLGEAREHDRDLCNKRDPVSFEMLCPACDARDSIDGVVFHESAHITSDSFAEVDVNKVYELVREDLPWVDASSVNIPWHYKGKRASFGPVLQSIEPIYLPTTFNVVEDTYVNRRLYAHRPGVEKAMQRRMVQTFERGFHQANGEHIEWKKQPIDAQAAMVAYLLGARLPHLIVNLDEKVQPLANDPVLQAERENIPLDGTVEDRFKVTFRVLTRLRELGFCIPPSQKEQEPEDEPVLPPPPPQGDDEEMAPTIPSDPQPPTEGQQGDKEGDEDEDAQQQGAGGESDPDEESEKGEHADGEAEGDGGEGDDDEEGDDDAEGGGSGTDDEDSDDESEGDAGKDDGDDGDAGGEGDDADSKDDGDDQNLPSGSGDPMEGDDGDSKDDGPTPEELDQKAREEMEKFAKQMMGHEEQEQESGDYTEPEDGLKPHASPQDDDEQSSIDKAVRWQKFDKPPGGIGDFHEVHPDTFRNKRYGYEDIPFEPGLVSGETARLRSVFALNRKRRMTGSLKQGPRLDTPNLHRIGQDDFRIFGRQDRPDKRDWFVLVGLDDSSSTHSNGAAPFIREMALAVGEMLNGSGVKFAMYGHGGVAPGGAYSLRVTSQWEVRHLIVKGPDEAWTPECKERIKALGRDNCCNYDGHTLEQYRKIIEKRRETDKMILYFTDGAMPMMNYDEELEVLQRELTILRQRRVNLFGVGYQTDSPKQHGMDTIVVQDARDLRTLIDGLRQRLELA